MKLYQLRSSLHAFPAALPRFILPDGDLIPAHAHLTEVGHVTKRFIDCGGAIGEQESVVLQTWVGDDTDHRLTSERFAKILQLGGRVLPGDNLPVEVEYDCCVVAQYPVEAVRRTAIISTSFWARNARNVLRASVGSRGESPAAQKQRLVADLT